jgi:hypothetical protein
MVESYYALFEDDARVVARALIHYNNYLLGEFNKISDREEVSDLVKEAALEKYQERQTENTMLHVRLAETFESLRQA